MITQGHILTTTKAVPEYPRRHELFSSLYCNVFPRSTLHCDGDGNRSSLRFSQLRQLYHHQFQNELLPKFCLWDFLNLYRNLDLISFTVQDTGFVVTVAGCSRFAGHLEAVVLKELCDAVDFFFASKREGNMRKTAS